uniref:DHC_N2 domain-containing protein n=1 Tax=Ascaris lumbricoides TaxID=6252 RepID=A0A0M3ILC1_ASCLU
MHDFLRVAEALFQMLEKEVILQCRSQDIQLVEKLLPECLHELEEAWGEKTKVTIDRMNYLPAESAGGVELSAKGGKIRVSSTLESRLELIANQSWLGDQGSPTRNGEPRLTYPHRITGS